MTLDEIEEHAKNPYWWYGKHILALVACVRAGDAVMACEDRNDCRMKEEAYYAARAKLEGT